jgi:hypothetical protein
MKHSRIQEHNEKNYKLAYEAWLSEGSIERARLKLEREGIINSYGKPYSYQGVHRAALCYITANYLEVRKMMIDKYHEMGYGDGVEENVDRYLIKVAVKILRLEKNVIAWLKENGLYGKYVDFIDSLIAISYDE